MVANSRYIVREIRKAHYKIARNNRVLLNKLKSEFNHNNETLLCILQDISHSHQQLTDWIRKTHGCVDRGSSNSVKRQSSQSSMKSQQVQYQSKEHTRKVNQKKYPSILTEDKIDKLQKAYNQPLKKQSDNKFNKMIEQQNKQSVVDNKTLQKQKSSLYSIENSQIENLPNRRNDQNTRIHSKQFKIIQPKIQKKENKILTPSILKDNQNIQNVQQQCQNNLVNQRVKMFQSLRNWQQKYPWFQRQEHRGQYPIYSLNFSQLDRNYQIRQLDKKIIQFIGQYKKDQKYLKQLKIQIKQIILPNYISLAMNQLMSIQWNNIQEIIITKIKPSYDYIREISKTLRFQTTKIKIRMNLFDINFLNAIQSSKMKMNNRIIMQVEYMGAQDFLAFLDLDFKKLQDIDIAYQIPQQKEKRHINIGKLKRMFNNPQFWQYFTSDYFSYQWLKCLQADYPKTNKQQKLYLTLTEH